MEPHGHVPNFLSKVLESVLLDDLRKEIAPDLVQYGGIKRCSVNHLLVNLYESVLSPLVKGDPSIVIGINYKKAFNRLDHQECLRQLRQLGASDVSLGLVRAFLTDRSMRIRVAGELTEARKLCGGSPQGSILGCMLYCATTQRIGPDLQATPTHQRRPPAGSPMPTAPPPASPANSATVHPDAGTGVLPTTAVGAQNEESPSFQMMPRLAPDAASSKSEGDDSFLTAPGSPVAILGVELGLEFFKYVDDTTVVERVGHERGVRHITTSAPQEEIQAPLLEPLMERIISEVKAIGMRVHCGKTQMIVISNDTGYNTTASKTAGGVTIQSVESMKLLGFMVSGSGMSVQVAFIKDKFRRKFWCLIHLRQSRIKGDHLFRLYCVIVPPVIETNSIVYHSMLTQTQSQTIEKLQKKVLRLCYGNFLCYETMLSEHSILSMEERRIKTIRKFTQNIMKNERFSEKWLVPRMDPDMNIRNRRPYVENHARTSRYQNSPLLYIQRTANDIVTNNL